MLRADAQDLERASSRLGEVVLDPRVWPQLMDDICRAVGAEGAILIQSDAPSPTDIPYTESLKEAARSYFAEGWHKRDPRVARAVPLLRRGMPVISEENTITPEEMGHDPFYNEFLLPAGLQWYMAVGFSAGSDAQWTLSIQRTLRQGAFEKSDMRLLAGLAQHLTEAATLSSAVGRVALSSGINALGAIRQPALAIDHHGLVLDANAAMEGILDQHIRIRNKRLWVGDPEAQSSLERLTERIMAGAETAALIGSDPIVIKRWDRASVVARVMAVPPAARNPFLGARAIMTFVSLEPKRRPAASLLALAFGLTPAAARLGSALATGTSLSEAADELGISRETARNQLKSVFAKTDTHRQSELVALLSRL